MLESKRLCYAIAVYIAGSVVLAVLPQDLMPIVAYVIQVAIYILIGLILGNSLISTNQTGRAIFLVVIIFTIVLIIAPIINVSFGITRFLFDSHVEIFPAIVLGICVRSLYSLKQE